MVIKRQRDGRRRFDPQAKRELIEACLQPGISVAGLALEHGVNANLLRTWITRYRRAHAEAIPRPGVVPSAVSAFVAVSAIRAPACKDRFHVQARLPNGVEVDLGEASVQALSSILPMLSSLPCSGSTRG